MKRLLPFLRSMLRGTVQGLRSSPVPASVATATIGLCLVLVGSFTLVVWNMQGLVDRFDRDLRVVAYLRAEPDPAARDALLEAARSVPGVAAARYVSPDTALERFREGVGRSGLLEGLEENPLPASLEVELAPGRRGGRDVERVVAALAGLDGVDELASGQEWIEGYARTLGLVRGIAGVLGAVLVLAALVLVASSIRLAVYSRRDEIEILTLVGASRTFVRVPFVLEGLVQGIVGAGLALLLLYALFQLALPELREGLSFLLGNVEPRFFRPGEVALVLAAGMGLGAGGSLLALAQERVA